MGKIRTLLRVSGLQKALLATEGYTINKIPNIPQCTLPPHPVYQTLLSIFQGSGSEITGPAARPGSVLKVMRSQTMQLYLQPNENDPAVLTTKTLLATQNVLFTVCFM